MKILRVLKSHFLPTSMILILSLFLIGEISAAIYYVSPNGNDSNSGLISAPFKNIQRAADIVNPGDSVIVKNGTYTDTNKDNYVVWLRRSGTSGSPITFKAENKWGAILDGQNYTTNMGFILDNADYIRIVDFEIKEMKYGGIASKSGSIDAHIYRNEIHHNGRYYIDPCTEDTTGHTGIGVCSSCSGWTIDSNIIYTIGRLPGGACSQYSWYDYNQDHCLYLSGSDAVIKNNVFYDCKSGWAIHAYPAPISNIEVINNTFYGTNPERDGHILISGAQSNWIIQNNIFHSPRNWAVQGGSSDDTNVVIKNNLVYNAIIASTGNCDGVKWKCTDNITGDPKFTNLSGYDFHLLSNSPAIDKGLDFPGRTVDADGKSIVGLPDIGAYEYVGTSPPPPPTPDEPTLNP